MENSSEHTQAGNDNEVLSLLEDPTSHSAVKFAAPAIIDSLQQKQSGESSQE